MSWNTTHFLSEWCKTVDVMINPDTVLLRNRFRLTPNIRIKNLVQELEDNIGRGLDTIPHSDAW